MTIDVTTENRKALIAVKGRLDTMTGPELEAKIKELIEEVDEITFDFSNLEYMSSSGLRILLATHKKLTSTQGSMWVKNANPDIKEIFKVTGMEMILNII